MRDYGLLQRAKLRSSVVSSRKRFSSRSAPSGSDKAVAIAAKQGLNLFSVLLASISHLVLGFSVPAQNQACCFDSGNGWVSMYVI